MKKLLLLLLIPLNTAWGQVPISLEDCRMWAADYSPLSGQKTATAEAGDWMVKSLNTGYRPQADINAQGTYQSDVTSVPFSAPGMVIDPMSKDQYKATLDVVQTIYDGSNIANQKALQQAKTAVEVQQAEVGIQSVREQVDRIFLAILMADESMEVLKLMTQDLASRLKSMRALYAQGVVLKSNVDILEAEDLKADQQVLELKMSRKTLVDKLAVLTGKPMDEAVQLVRPQVELNPIYAQASERPELRLYDLQKTALDQQSNLLGSKNLPKLYAFGSGGYGKPTFNMLKNEFDWLYIVGIKLSVPITSYGSVNRQRKAIVAQKAVVDRQRELFEQTNLMQVKQQLNEIEKLKTLITSDAEIVAKRESIRKQSAAQLESGVITSSDYLIQLNAEAQAALNKRLHEVQLIQAIVMYQELLGK